MAVDDAYTKTLIHFNGADASTIFTDESGKTWAVSGDAQIDTDLTDAFGGNAGVGKFDGAGDDIYITGNDADFDFTTGDFTVDLWVYPSAKANYRRLVGYGALTPGWSATTGWHWVFGIQNDGTIDFQYQITGDDTSNTADPCSTVTTLVDGTWTHLAVVRTGTTIYIFINGIISATLTNAPAMVLPSNTKSICIATYPGESADTYRYVGYIDELRISKGIARWTANFTPPTAEYEPPADHEIPASPLEGTFTLTSAGATLIDPTQKVLTEPLNGAFTLTSGDVRLIQRTQITNTLALVNSLQVGSTLNLVNSINLQLSSNTILLLDLLQSFGGNLALKLDVKERSDVNGIINILNNLLGANAGINYGEYYFSRNHGL